MDHSTHIEHITPSTTDMPTEVHLREAVVSHQLPPDQADKPALQELDKQLEACACEE